MKFPKSLFWTVLSRQKIHHFLFSHTWSTRSKYFPEGCPYMLMYSVVLWLFGCVHPENRTKNFDFSILWIKTKCCLHKTWSDRWNKVVHYVFLFSTASNWFVTLYYKLLTLVSSSSKHSCWWSSLLLYPISMVYNNFHIQNVILLSFIIFLFAVRSWLDLITTFSACSTATPSGTWR